MTPGDVCRATTFERVIVTEEGMVVKYKFKSVKSVHFVFAYLGPTSSTEPIDAEEFEQRMNDMGWFRKPTRKKKKL